ncbi:MAG: methylenetetrahydrofolate reductase [Candidatus Saccharicenans sp.]|nr:MAG: 5,10-methylenetetrahydrofolate reductase [Candidatus Aminicenantes bacterium]HEK85459.1 5,10-methylenetetrahydrofolate reductase [Candidatus Aminicenantes bacterium]
MKVTEKIKKGPILSLEILPPDRGKNLEEIFQILDRLLKFPVDFISVTKHPPEITYLELPDKIIKVPKVKRPGSIGITAALLNKCRLEVIPHVLCYGMSKYELEDMLIDLHLLGVRNVFIVRGEYENHQPVEVQDEYQHAEELVRQVAGLNRGEYLYPCENAQPTDFCIGVAGYPEKHPESPNPTEDLKQLRTKVEAGADFIFTQMVFDFEIYQTFIERAAAFSIKVPIIPGIKPIISLKTVYNLPRKFFVNIPEELVNQLQEARTPEMEFKVGTKYMAELVQKLLDSGAPGVHVFTMGKGQGTQALLQALYGKEI